MALAGSCFTSQSFGLRGRRGWCSVLCMQKTARASRVPTQQQVLDALDHLVLAWPDEPHGWSAIDVRNIIGTRGITWRTCKAVLDNMAGDLLVHRTVVTNDDGYRIPVYRKVGG